MKREVLVAVAAVALFGASIAPAALAGDDHRGHDHRGRYVERHEGRHDDRHDHHYRHRAPLYVVHFHLDGGSRSIRLKSDDRAGRVLDLLRSVGVSAHRDGGRTVHYRLRGNARAVRRSHEDAHYLARKLETFGFHAHVDHE